MPLSILERKTVGWLKPGTDPFRRSERAPGGGNHAIAFTHEKPQDKAILIGFGKPDSGAGDTIEELALLTETAGAKVVGHLAQRRASVHPGNFLSRGKVEELLELKESTSPDLVISDEDLSPAQVRNLERLLELRVVDRSELILDIFAQRARTREARIQVELAQLRYLLPRLAGMWGHLSRTGGGIGTRGPGETQLEVDRRQVRQKISVLEKRLEKVELDHSIQTRKRRHSFRVSLVGYTNAGKSTLFNRLTGAGVLEEDKLFATLDTTTRRVNLDERLAVLLSDTVGFIRKLPHHLVASFRATLRDVQTADLIVHVVDAAHPSYRRQIEAVEGVLDGLLDHPVPRLLVFNKTDLFEDETKELEIKISAPDAVLISALDPEGLRVFRDRLAKAIRDLRTMVRVECAHARLGELRELTRRGEHRAVQYLDGSVWSEFCLDRSELLALRRAGFRVETAETR